MIFDKYTTESFGAQRITTWLNEQGYRARTGKMWHPATIRGILHNLTYTGVMRSGESRSEIIPDLQIIPIEQFERTQEILKARSEKHFPNVKYRLTREVSHCLPELRIAVTVVQSSHLQQAADTESVLTEQ